MAPYRRRKIVRFSVRDDVWADVVSISQAHGMRTCTAARLLMKLGIRALRQGRGLVCGYDNCTRSKCCGGEPRAVRSKLLRFKVVKSVES